MKRSNTLSLRRAILAGLVTCAVLPSSGNEQNTGQPSPTGASPTIIIRTFHSVTAPANHPLGELGVGRGFKVIGCGAKVNYYGYGSMLTAVFPTDHNTCVAAAKDHKDPDPATLEIWAVGLYDPDEAWQVRIFTSSSGVTAHPNAQVSVDPTYVMTGGGAQVKYGGFGNMLTATYPLSRHIWAAESKDHLMSDPASLIVYAIGIKPTTPRLPLPETQLFYGISAVAAHPAQAVALTGGFTLTAGGARDEYCGAGNLLVGTYPSSPNTWAASGKDHIEPDPTTLAVYAIGIRTAAGGEKGVLSEQQQTPPPAKTCAVAAVLTSSENSICISPAIRVAMQSIEDQAIHDPNGTALSVLGALITGIDASSGRPLVIDSKTGSDGGRYTSRDPGSFVCRGLFIRGQVRIEELPGADAAADATAAIVEKLTKKYPTFVEWFKAKPLPGERYMLTLLPSSLQLSREYSAEFSISGR